MVKGLASFWYWDLLRNGIERKNFGLDESWYIALLGNIYALCSTFVLFE
jgi:hypothetical protein